AGLSWIYGGPGVNCDPFAPTSALVAANEALRTLFGWFLSAGGTASRPTGGASLPGISTRIAPDLKPPSVREYTVGAGVALAPNGFLVVGFLHRDLCVRYLCGFD